MVQQKYQHRYNGNPFLYVRYLEKTCLLVDPVMSPSALVYHDDIVDDFDVLIILMASCSASFVTRLAGRLLSPDEG